MLRIYHAPRSRSMRVLWLAEEIGLAYQLEMLGMFTPEMKKPDYLAIHPLGKVPAIDDDGFVLSRAGPGRARPGDRPGVGGRGGACPR